MDEINVKADLTEILSVLTHNDFAFKVTLSAIINIFKAKNLLTEEEIEKESKAVKETLIQQVKSGFKTEI